jgi:trans-2,3-dihydro-3-hydroxyanthranilate isomerase
VLLGLLDGGEQERELIVAEKIGPVRCRVSPRGGEGGHAVFQIPRLPAEGTRPPNAATIAAAIGLSGGEVGFDNFAAARWSAGNPFTFVPLASRDAVARCRPDLARFDAAFGGDEIAAPFVFWETSEAGNHFHARMFAPNLGIAEDPATGSAAAAFAGYLAASSRYGDGDHVVRIEQGYEMGRPSLIILTMTLRQGRLVAASIGGDAVVVSEGTIQA